MKALTKKQKRILKAVEDSLAIEFKVLKDYKEANNVAMVSHMQDSMGNEISGVMSFLIYSDMSTYQALDDKLWELKRCKELTDY